MFQTVINEMLGERGRAFLDFLAGRWIVFALPLMVYGLLLVRGRWNLHQIENRLREKIGRSRIDGEVLSRLREEEGLWPSLSESGTGLFWADRSSFRFFRPSLKSFLFLEERKLRRIKT